MQKNSANVSVSREKVLALIYQALDEIQEGSDQDRVPKSPETILLGPASGLDSLKLVNLIVAVEQKIEGEFGFAISAIANEQAMSQKTSPLRTVGTLANFVLSILMQVKK